MWVTIPYSDEPVKEPYKMEPHKPATRHHNGSRFTWPVCQNCGLVYLKNDATAHCIRLGCRYRDHATYGSWWRRTR